MRTASFVLAPLLVALIAAPAPAQVSATIQIGPIGGPVYRRPAGPPPIVIVDYDRGRHGRWDRDARYWRPVTVYVVGGRFYERPWGNARPVTVFRYRDQFFFGPRDRDWERQRDWYRRQYWDRIDDRRDRAYYWEREQDRREWERDRRQWERERERDRREWQRDRERDRREWERDRRADRRDDRRDDRGDDRRNDRRDNNGRSRGRQ